MSHHLQPSDQTDHEIAGVADTEITAKCFPVCSQKMEQVLLQEIQTFLCFSCTGEKWTGLTEEKKVKRADYHMW